MALILYKCDTCKRTVSRPQNSRGLEVVSRCVITLGCRGRLYQDDVLEDFVRGQLPPDVVGLENWQQRRLVFNHSQAKQESVWNVVHNLGTVPVVSVFIDAPTIDNPNNREEVTPIDTQIISSDIIRLVFASPVTGEAQLVARSSDPQLLQPTDVVTGVAPLLQITNGGELTIATNTGQPEEARIQMVLKFVTPEGIEVPVTYDVDDNPSARSPWVSANRVLIQGSIYLVRSFNPIEIAVSSGVVPEGSTVQVIGFNPNTNFNAVSPIVSNKVFILLADQPQAAVDRIVDRVIDANILSGPSATAQAIIDGNEIHVTEGTIQTIHPTIRVL